MTGTNGRNSRRVAGDRGENEKTRPVRREQPQTVSTTQLGDDRPTGAGTAASAAVMTQQVSVETDAVAATLVDVPLVDVTELVYEHQLDLERRENGDTTQPVALFDLHNVGSVPIEWSSSRTQFIGDDGYTYSAAQLSIDPGELGPGIHTRRVEIQPGRSARVATLVEQLPAGVSVAEVVQQVTTSAAGDGPDQLVFRLAE